MSWQDELQLDHRRRLRNASFVSLALHVVVFAAFAISPPRSAPPLPAVLAVDLVAAMPNAAPAARPAPVAKLRPAPAPAAPPEPAPEPVAPPPPPPPKAPVQVLPEEAPLRIKKLERKPAPEKTKAVAKVEPKPAPPKPAPVAPKPKPPEELSYEDAMAALDEELGEDETADLRAPAPPRALPSVPAESSGRPGVASGAVVSPELARWSLATRRRIQGVWVAPQNFRGRGLATLLELELSASGDVLGEPQVLRSSGDPYFDDNAVRAVLMASPLPPPPQPGTRSFLFRSEAD
jgi:TonB family protein